MLAVLAVAAALAGSADYPIGAFRITRNPQLPTGTVGTLIASTGEAGSAPVATLTTPEGEPVDQLPAGYYRVLVRDRHLEVNFHLFNASLGFDESTSGRFTGSQEWTAGIAGDWGRFRLVPARPSLPYDTVAQAVSLFVDDDYRPLQLVDTRAEANRLASQVIAGHANAVAAVDLRRFVLVTAFRPVPDLGRIIGITQLRRERNRLLIRYARRWHGYSLPALGTAYHVVKIPRSALRSPLPTRVTSESVGVLPPPPQG